MNKNATPERDPSTTAISEIERLNFVLQQSEGVIIESSEPALNEEAFRRLDKKLEALEIAVGAGAIGAADILLL